MTPIGLLKGYFLLGAGIAEYDDAGDLRHFLPAIDGRVIERPGGRFVLAYVVPSESITGSVHTLHFDAASYAHVLEVFLMRGDHIVAKVCPAAEAPDAVGADVRAWNAGKRSGRVRRDIDAVLDATLDEIEREWSVK